jgi:phenylalanyl-tRNA synthetase beta chain
MRPERASALLGYSVDAADARAVFDTLGMDHRDAGAAIEVEVPGYRTDVELEVDLIEEIVRVQGYERVGSTLPRAPHPGGLPADAVFAARVKDALVRAGLREIRPAPFVSQDDLDLFGDTDAIGVANPLRAEEGFLRTRLTPGLLHAVARNLAWGVPRVALFEVGTTFRLGDPFIETLKLGFALCGSAGEGWADERRELDVLDARGVLEAVSEDLGIRAWSLGPPPDGPFHPGRSASITVDGQHAGVLGEIHPRVAESLGIDRRVAVVALGLAPLRDAAERAFAFRPIPRFPPVRRDLAFVVPESVAAGDLTATLEEAGGALLTRCALFDVFRGSPLAEGAKSFAFAIEIRDPERTLTDDEAQAVIGRMVAAARERHGAELRTG